MSRVDFISGNTGTRVDMLSTKHIKRGHITEKVVKVKKEKRHRSAMDVFMRAYQEHMAEIGGGIGIGGGR